MGNVFTNAGDAWASALRVRQPERANCKVLATPPPVPDTLPPAPILDRPAGNVQLQLLFARAGPGFALPYAGGPGAL